MKKDDIKKYNKINNKKAPVIRLRLLKFWSGKRDSNSRPQPWQGCALPTELFPQYVSPSAKEAFNLPFRHPKLAFRDCKYKLKNLFCKIFRRILSQNDVPGLRKSRGHPYGKPLYPGGGMNRPAGNRGINEPGNLRRHAPGWAAGHKYHPGACCVRP